jgi:hypothetical protein
MSLSMFSLVCLIVLCWLDLDAISQELENTYHVYVRFFLLQSHILNETDVYNKIDSISLEQMDKLARSEHSVVISCEMDLKCVHMSTL